MEELKPEKTFLFNPALGKIKSVFAYSWKRGRSLFSFRQWRIIFKTFGEKEKVAFCVLFLLAFCSFIFLIQGFYFRQTEIKPARGGIYIEGVNRQLGQPEFINPVLTSSNDADNDLVELIFSGLMKYNANGEIVPDLAKEYPQIKEGGKIYDFYLRENIYWHDDQPFSVDDIIFTIETIKNPDFKSPSQAIWFSVEVEKIGENGIRFKLDNPYPTFLETTTQKIIPKHIWQNVNAQGFLLEKLNLQPIGTGPYKFKILNYNKSGQVKNLELESNNDYFGQKPFIPKISFLFFENEEEVVSALKKGEIKGTSNVSSENIRNINKSNLEIHRILFPRYFDISFNPQKSEILKEKEVRMALNYGTNKSEIIDKILFGQGKEVNSPFLSEIINLPPPSKIYKFDLEKGKEVLENAGWIDTNGDGKREKVNKGKQDFQLKSDLKLGSRGEEVEELQKCLTEDSEVYPEKEISGYFGETTKQAVIKFQEKYKKEILEPFGLEKGTGIVRDATRNKLNEICFSKFETIIPLKFSLTVPNQKELSQELFLVADLIKNQWQKLGVEIEIKPIDMLIQESQQSFLKERDYESLLVGKVSGLIPDPYPSWHSSQKRDPGMNLAGYDNKEADSLLEDARNIQDLSERAEKYRKFQDILIDDAPVVFLYSPDFLYPVSNEIKGISARVISKPSKRFVDIENWYINTKRVWK